MSDPGHPVGPGPNDDDAFEALLWDLSLRFVEMPSQAIDSQVRDAQRWCCALFGLDRSALAQIDPEDPRALIVTHVYDRNVSEEGLDPETGASGEGAERTFPVAASAPAAGVLRSTDDFPWVTRRLIEGLTTIVSDLDTLPAEAAVDAQTLRRAGTMSTIIIPLKSDAGILGGVSFATTREPRDWNPQLVRRLELLGHVFGRALARKRQSMLDRGREEIDRATFQQAAVGMAHVAADGSWLRVNDRLCEILGYGRKELVGGMTFQHITHPDDLQADLESARALLSGRLTTYSTEKRYVRRDRSVVWTTLTVSLVRNEAGRPKYFISVVQDITDRKRAEVELQVALADLQRLRDQLQRENVSLRDEVQRRGATALVVGTSAAIRSALGLADQVAPTGATVLLLGETGTGKERFANYIHEHSPRRGRTMVRVNCAAIPSTLIESELFGREKGAFTGALARQVGRFELASGSTIFLDEIGDLPLDVQVKLLRVIEERRVERLGNPRPVPVDVRIIAATHRDLELAVREARFREDLYYRLNVFPITLPPLRERLEDIPLLAKSMIDELGRRMGKRFDPLSQGTLKALRRYQWPGNIRELRNVLERAMITSAAPALQVAVPAAAPEPRPAAAGSALKDVERAHVLAVLEQTGWRIRGPHGAAAVLGLPPTTLENRMRKLEISRPRQKT